jgi:hypothetical protein
MENNVKIMEKSDLISIRSKNREKSFIKFLENDFFKNHQNLQKEMKKFFQNIQYQHHNEMNFIQNIKEIFQEKLINGQEDQAALVCDGTVLIFTMSDHGVYLGLIFKNDIFNEEEWKKCEKMVGLLELGINNPKGFHTMLSYEDLNHQLINQSYKTNQIKI